MKGVVVKTSQEERVGEGVYWDVVIHVGTFLFTFSITVGAWMKLDGMGSWLWTRINSHSLAINRQTSLR